jgi:hypothetical protein
MGLGASLQRHIVNMTDIRLRETEQHASTAIPFKTCRQPVAMLDRSVL